MRVPTTMTLDVAVLSETRDTALELGVPMSALTELGLKYVLSQPREKLAAWARTVGEKRGRPAQGMRANERRVLKALEVLEGEVAPTFRFSPEDIARRGGLKVRDSFDALRSLQARQMVAMGSFGDASELDRWDRPKNSRWWRVEAEAAWRERTVPR